jgi:hypothetical protein
MYLLCHCMHPTRAPIPPSVKEARESYFVYRQSLRILIKNDTNIDQMRRTFCWQRLMRLHQFEPSHYPDPHHLFWQFKRDLAA